MSSELIAQAEAIITRANTTQFYLSKANEELDEIVGELLVISVNGTNSPHVRTASGIIVPIQTEIDAAKYDVAIIRSEMRDWIGKMQ